MNIAQPTGIVRNIAGPYAAYTVEMEPWDADALFQLALGYPATVELTAAQPEASHRPTAWVLDDNRIAIHVPEEENIRRAILLARYFALVVGDAVVLPHLQGQAVYGEDTPEVRERILPDCERVAWCLAQDDSNGLMAAIQREDGQTHGGTEREVMAHDMTCSNGNEAVCHTWPEWAEILRGAGIDPNEEVETVWSLRRRSAALLARADGTGSDRGDTASTDPRPTNGAAMTDITQDPTASLDHWLLKGAHRSPDGTEWYGRHNGEMWVAKSGPPGWRARIVSGAALNRAGGPTLWKALDILCGLAGWKQPAGQEDGPIDWDKQRPEVGDHEPEDLVALSDYGWHLDIHDDLVLCPSREAALRMQSWWDRANAAEAERDRLTANAEARERLLTRRTDALRAAERRIEALEAAAAPDWRPGVPSVEDVRAHEARGGLWVFRIQDDAHPEVPDFDQLLVIDERNQHPSRVPAKPFVASLTAKLEYVKPGQPEWTPLDLSEHPMGLFTYEFRPCSPDGTPAPWPVHGDSASLDPALPDGFDMPNIAATGLRPMCNYRGPSVCMKGGDCGRHNRCVYVCLVGGATGDNPTDGGDCEGVADAD